MPARFVERLNRFAAEVEVDAERVTAHIPNTGRMSELLVPGREAMLMPAADPGRKTRWDLVLIRHRDGRSDEWVCTDSREANRVMGLAFDQAASGDARAAEMLIHFFGRAFEGVRRVRREAPLGGHRIDFLVEKGATDLWVEVKSVNLVRDGRALFPDAPTGRGRMHLDALRAEAEQGRRACVVFVVQRGDATRFSPHRETDPAFARSLEEAGRAGVEVHAASLHVSIEGTRFGRRLDVDL